MKYRWKLLILLLCISIVPVVSLRTFGIHNVRLMAEALIDRNRQKQEDEVAAKLHLLIQDYSRALETIREKAEMALYFQTFGMSRLLKNEVLWQPADTIDNHLLSPLPEEKGQGHRTRGTLPAVQDVPLASGFDSSQCFSIPPRVAEKQARAAMAALQMMLPVYQAVEQYLGDLVLRQYSAFENGMFSVYPCRHETRMRLDARNQTWYRSAFEESLTAWSRPYTDPLSGRTVMAVSLPVTREDESVIGVGSLLVPLNNLIDPALSIFEIPSGTHSFLCTLAIDPATGKAGAKIVAVRNPPETSASGKDADPGHQWLVSADKIQMRQLLEDFARRRYHIRQMPFNERMSYWAYGPLLHHGTAFVFVIPRNEILKQNLPAIELIRARVSRVELYTAAFLVVLVALAVLLALWFSRTVTRPLELLATAAKKLAAGNFETTVTIKSRDEFAELGKIFNEIGPQLKERYKMRRSLDLAMEIQQSLLPESPPELAGLDIHGMTLFSEKTGGDYYDYLCVTKKEPPKLCVVVGDVTGHGIPAALLMATASAFLRLRATLAGSLKEIVGDVNREFCREVEASSRFMTLFIARIDRERNHIQWVRAGHDPAILYDAATDAFSPLNANGGLPLGVATDSVYQESTRAIKAGQIIFMGTDGIWETRNPQGDMFGKDRLKQIIRQNAGASARQIALAIVNGVTEFRGLQEQEDDLTLVIIKIEATEST